jgi:phenylalanyl-tRNA synthetase beta chain
MKILVSWLRDFVDVGVPPEDLGRTLTMRGFELSSVEPVSVVPIGSDAGSPDAVLDFEIHANRPDALSVIGFARETAAAYSLSVRQPHLAQLPAGGSSAVTVELEAPDLCPRYAAAVADVAIGPSPPWLASRLHASGVRPINNVVDVTNYVLLELGQPMHAFDLTKLAGREIRVRRASRGERMKTLDGVDRVLDSDMLVIADGEKSQAIAGVMGGGLSEVSEKTTTIVLESAFFKPQSVRRTSKRIGLKTEASARFERGTDVNAPVVGLERAIALLQHIGAGQPRDGVIDHYPVPVSPLTLSLRHERLRRILGQEVPDRDVERILNDLAFHIRRANHSENQRAWTVTVPTFRVDVAREIDLIEEIGRHYGYDRLPATFPPLADPAPPPDPRISRDRLIRTVLLAAGCSEALTFSFIDGALASHFADPAAVVPIANPLASQFSVLRPSLLPGLLASVAHNRNREQNDIQLFELGAVMTREGETRQVAVAWTSLGTSGHWSSARRPVDFFDVKGLAERVAEALQVHVVFRTDQVPTYLTRGRAAAVTANDRIAGAVGMLTPATVAAAGLASNEEVYVAELDLDVLAAARSTEPLIVKPLPRYPSIARDISIVVDDVLPAAAVRGTIRSAAPETLVSVREFDRYQGKGVPDGRVSLSLRLTFRSSERTLTDAEVQKAMDAIIAALVKEHKAIQR